ncbi:MULTISPECIES: hypothetical protein [Paenarthrobacter]|jgi:hypothetical protein|uniref:Uncharacterized protein n=1 Tax=Paenarthrobacter nicotinovorans TaxID=29320 RepID=A0ABT9TP35_PAENI|nr:MULTISPECIES: hypothetical protein [Paenarthrobacter]KIA71165.1 hypothetical protein ANMWB30_42150 [Arthrobacter sp. MWB30]KQR03929.1 hypothetical protein ASF74_17990 [Arthrobacter sp. Leaf145]SKB96375.1 hypothetical protein SAMN05660916_03598 [Arthrobacter sp. 31Cvi3.1E]BCW12586.1 hypothetical protein NtRootA2_38680 [Arthrobacter sp. NtRootA2]BCW16668.1 hypothetical protein NtRootA4_36470 [Arthrobacter sp. NtRootA4]BCW25001.1 hypothetical protein NtRootC7_38680 [Arthrobacter sp. NtRootC7]
MEQTFDIELVNQNEYLVRWASEGQSGESLIHTNPAFLAEVGLEGIDEQRIVEETTSYLAERQPVIDFPQTVDLEEIAAAYTDYTEQLKSRLQAK